jgi:hypothetical protein
VPNGEWLFAVHFADRCCCDDLLTELASRLLRQVGYTNPDVAEMVASLGAELDRELDGHEAGYRAGRAVEFRAREGQLQIVMFRPGGHEWRLARPLP